mmetsp:Transcript_9593/g.14299  ORF Transcript_9593/g.14299 Transcript_9593/m.14299 type:complete len:404 (-) Transcript_9593:407-1618(-)|eukprot:CAMPEP_0203667856 /NCGR_PEP_ID=MMETSP0090-20130426/4593_1 /ASSEMBLY_ACC=CAM_ASM_001088 /TAXON_ID=426623 /ORGANISM="Chaetoceros affinis, Strain CCMP159" /LENGTH=403 /DNA_ID=CAMNT_0050532131 /DNA_START=1 /DNA_END=1212 /DNA_ORIENTATION=-
MSSSSSSPSQPPAPNPILSAYEKFQNDTPLITRYILTTYTASYLLTSLFLPQFTLYAILNIPYFTIFHFEFYRIFTTLFVCTSFLNLIFGWIVLLGTGRRIEQSLGSTNYGVLTVGCFGALPQFVFVTCVWLVYLLSGNSSGGDAASDSIDSSGDNNSGSGNAVSAMTRMMVHNSDGGGLWIFIFGLLALECAYDHRSNTASTRRLFLMEIQTLYYPLALLALFTIFDMGSSSSSSNRLLGHLPEITSLCIGYAIGLGKMRLGQILSLERRKYVEESFVRPLTTRIGWVVGPPSVSSDLVLILPLSQPSSYSNATSSVISRFGNRPHDEEQGWRPASSTNINSNVSGSGTGSGHTLGSGIPTRRSNVAAATSSSQSFDNQQQQRGREALLAAAEQRAKNIEKK